VRYRARCVLLLALAAGPRAHADVAADASAHAEKGATAYTLGNFTEAITELKLAYELDHDPRDLYNLALAYRKIGDRENAAFELRQYLSIPDVPARDKAEKMLAEIEAEQKAEAEHTGVLQRQADELARTKAELARTQAELAAATHREPGTLRVSLAAGAGSAYIVGAHLRDVGLTSAVGVSKVMRRRGGVTLDLGGTLTVLSFPYTGSDGIGHSVYYASLLASGAASVDVSARWFLGGELSAGVGSYSSMFAGNPFAKGGAALPDAGSFDTRLALAVGYRMSPAIEAVYELAANAGTRAPPFRDQISGVVAISWLTLGLRVLL
jgi:hypothetical protein